MRPHIIGIAGPSSSGKSELARHLVEKLPGTAIVSLDSYYRGMEEIPLEARKKVNFDHPDALDWTLLHEHLKAMAAGGAFDEPVYSFADYARTSLSRRIEPGKYVIAEGLFVLYWPELRDMLDTKVYVETDPGVCFNRRLTWPSAGGPRNRSASSTNARCGRAPNGSFTQPGSSPIWWSRERNRSRNRPLP
jgi:uridine kinase